MGEVYRARDTKLGRPVAIKLIRSDKLDRNKTERFWREARAASQLNHPNILTVHDIQESEHGPFLVMEFIDGEPLDAVMRTRKLSRSEVYEFARQIAGALAAAHAAGIVHRDLKPGNIVVTHEGLVKVVDFGLAKLMEPDTAFDFDAPTMGALTEPGRLVGTPQYMSPEQAAGDPAGPASDVFSFGTIFYEMLAGIRPFQAKSRVDLLRKLITEPPPAIEERAPGLPAGVLAVLQKCLEKSAERRYQNGAELVRDLQRMQSDINTPTESIADGALATASQAGSPGTATASVIETVARSKAGRWIAAAVVGVLAIAGAISMFRSVRTSSKQRGVAVLPFAAVDGKDETRAFGLGLVMHASSALSSAAPFQKAFWVVPIPDVIQQKTQSAKDARDSFGVDLVVTGTVEKVNEQVRITANLNDATTQRQMRSRQITRLASDALALEDELSRAVAELLEIELPVGSRLTVRAGGSTEPAAEDYYLQGRGYLQSVDKADFAIGVFEQALTRDKQFARAYAGLAEAYLQKFRVSKEPVWIEKASSNAAEAIRIGGSIPEALLTEGAIEREQGHYQQAVDHLKQVIELEPRNRDAWIRLAQAYESMQRLPEAVDIEPGYPAGHSSQAGFYYRHGRYKEAERAFLRARELAPDNYRYWNSLGGLYIQQGRYADAEKTLQQSLALKPSALAYNNLTVVYFLQERYRDAIPPMEKALAMGEPSATLVGNLARLYRLTPGFEQKAAPLYQRAFELAEKQLQVNPKNAEVHADVAMLHAEIRDRAKAEQEIAIAKELAPANPAVLFRLVIAYESLGNRDQALEAFKGLAASGSYLEEVMRRPELKGLRADPRFPKIK
jgi:tetratricopeptide (TPR) repeat protein